VCNRTVENAVQALKGHGVGDVEIVADVTALDNAIERGATAVTDDPEVMRRSEVLECLLETTGLRGPGHHARH